MILDTINDITRDDIESTIIEIGAFIGYGTIDTIVGQLKHGPDSEVVIRLRYIPNERKLIAITKLVKAKPYPQEI